MQSVETQARWIAGLMAQSEGPATVQQTEVAQPPMQGDRTTRAANKGNASPKVSLQSPTLAATQAVKGQPAVGVAQQQQPQQQVQAPPPLFTDDKGRVVTGDGQPYLGLEIYATQNGYADAQGNPIDLEAVEAQYGIGQPAQTGGTQATGATQPAEDPNAAMVDYQKVDAKGRPQIVYPTGEPYLGRELFVDEASGGIFDKQGNAVDPATLGAPQGPTPEEQKLAKKIQVGTAIASGGFNMYMNKVWYNSTLPGMTSKLQSLKRASANFANGTGLQGKMKEMPVVGKYANWRQTARDGKIDKLTRNIKLQSMTPKQEALFMAKEKLTALKAESKAFTQGKGMLGRLKDAPVIGKYAQKTQANRQVEIRTLTAQIKAKDIPTTWKTKLGNATRGRILPGLMAIGSGWGTYTEIRDARRRADDPTNVRKWDDYTRIAGGAIQTGGALMALKRGNVKGAIITATAGTVISTVGEIFRD
jgi:hypothetical protein